MKNPWKKLSSKIVYRNHWIKVREDQVIRPDGQKGIYGMVMANISIAIVALTSKHEIFLVRQWRYIHGHQTLEIPWGGKKHKENDLQTAKRELLEETGVTAKQWRSLGKLIDYPAISSELVHLFLAQDLTFGRQRLDGDEKITVVKIPYKTAYLWAMSGIITDAVTMAALLKVNKYFKI